MKSLFYNWEGLYEYVLMGYAVVATDYAGLGTQGRHAYLDMLSNGMDVIHSVPAARAAVPHLSEKWVVVGHSQGGLSSLGVAQLEGTSPLNEDTTVHTCDIFTLNEDGLVQTLDIYYR